MYKPSRVPIFVFGLPPSSHLISFFLCGFSFFLLANTPPPSKYNLRDAHIDMILKSHKAGRQRRQRRMGN